MNNNLKAIGLIFLMAFFTLTITAFKKEARTATDYKVIYSKIQPQFQQTVKMYMNLGWELQGGVAIDSNGFYQAMTR
jgi:hypothetical protein